jgi:hypothetical protein
MAGAREGGQCIGQHAVGGQAMDRGHPLAVRIKRYFGYTRRFYLQAVREHPAAGSRHQQCALGRISDVVEAARAIG